MSKIGGSKTGRRIQQSSNDWSGLTLWHLTDGAVRQKTAASMILNSANTPRPISGRQLDLLLLAVCSCLLTLLCHPAPNLLQSPAGNTAPESSLPSTPSQINFYIKSALMSTFQKGKSEGLEDEG